MKTFQLLLVLLVLQSCRSGNSRELAEFYVEDVSREQVFIDSITGTHYNPLGGHIALEVSMEGELDSSAEVSFWYYPGNQYGGLILEKII